MLQVVNGIAEDFDGNIFFLQHAPNTYIIGHYNPSVRTIDLVSHTIYVVCVNIKSFHILFASTAIAGAFCYMSLSKSLA